MPALLTSTSSLPNALRAAFVAASHSLARDIQLHEASLAASRDDLVGNLLAFRLEDVGNDDLRAFLREDRRLALPHAAGTTGHERNFSGESHRVLSFFRATGVLSGRCARPAMAPPFTPSTSPVTYSA